MAALLIVLAAGPAFPQNRDILQLQRDMIDVRERVNQLQSTVDRDNALVKGLVERMADQLNTLASGMQKVTQTIDGMKTLNETATREERTALKSLNDSIKELEGDLSSARAQINSISRELTTMKTAGEPLAGPDEVWRDAKLDLILGNWSLAINGLQEFLSKYPDDPRAAEAQLSMGDALYAEKKYDLAITQYDIVLQKYPEGDKTRTALLKKGLALADSNQPQATTTLNEVAKKFPGTSEAIAAQAKLKELAAQRPKTPAR
jgi:tol-pal system protein YbgF